MSQLSDHADDASFQEAFAKAKRDNKDYFVQRVKEKADLLIDPDALFDVQIKRIHEYKRQLLNALQIVAVITSYSIHYTKLYEI